jgi:hypothetical protein
MNFAYNGSVFHLTKLSKATDLLDSMSFQLLSSHFKPQNFSLGDNSLLLHFPAKNRRFRTLPTFELLRKKTFKVTDTEVAEELVSIKIKHATFLVDPLQTNEFESLGRTLPL